MSFTEAMKQGRSAGTGIFAGTAEIFQRLGPDRRKNIETLVSGALTMVGGIFSVYVETDGSRHLSVRCGADLPQGFARALETRQTCFSSLPASGEKIVRLTAADDPLLDTYGIQSLIGAAVPPSGLLWVADEVTRRFSSDHIHGLCSLAGALASQSGPDTAQIVHDLAGISRKAAHDLNNILAGLISYPELVLMQLDTDSPLREPLAFIHESGLLASDIVQDLLFMIRPRSQGAPAIDPVPVVQAYFDGSAHAALKAAHPRIMFCHPPARSTLKIRISEILLSKIITTLMFHSAQNAPPGSRVDLTLSDRVRSDRAISDRAISDRGRGGAGDHMRIRVTDSGPPLFPEHMARFFDPYYAKKEMGRPGSGLDLAVLKKAVLDHGGQVNVHSPGTPGNVMEVCLPGITT